MSDVLVDLLIEELMMHDAITRGMRLGGIDSRRHKYLLGFEAAVSDLKIPAFNFYIGSSSGHLKWRSFTGPEKLKLFSELRLCEVMPEGERVDKIQSLWSRLLEINKLLM